MSTNSSTKAETEDVDSHMAKYVDKKMALSYLQLKLECIVRQPFHLILNGKSISFRYSDRERVRFKHMGQSDLTGSVHSSKINHSGKRKEERAEGEHLIV